MTRALLVGLVVLAGCEGTATLGGVDGGSTPSADGGHDAGVIITLSGFTQRSAGWPSGQALLGAALLNDVIYAITSGGLYSLPLTSTTWSQEPLTLGAQEAPTSLQRLDTNLVLTVASGSSGGVLTRAFDATTFSRVSAAPAQPSWQLVRKGSELYLATSGGLYAATDVSGPYLQRSADGTSLFTHRVPLFLAGLQQSRLFAAGDSASGLGSLFASDDDGVTWTTGLVTGTVRALAADGAFVFVQATAAQRSDNYGNTFKALGPVGSTVNVFVSNQGRLWAGTSSGLRTSDDDGLTWADDTNGLPSGTAVTNLVISGSLLIVDTPSGPWITRFQ